MRFVCDHDVDVGVVRVLRRLHHEAWTAGQAGLATATDDDLTVYAHERRAVLVTHDREFSQRRRRRVIGRHIWLRCDEWDAAELMSRRLDDLLPLLESADDIFIAVSKHGVETSRRWD